MIEPQIQNIIQYEEQPDQEDYELLSEGEIVH